MRKLFPLFLMLISLATSCKKEKQSVIPSFVLKGEVMNLDTTAFLAVTQHSLDTFVIDTVAISNNQFEFKHASDSLVKVDLLLGNKAYSVYTQGGDTVHVKIAGDSINVVGKAKPWTLWNINEYIANPSDSLAQYPSIIREQIETYRANDKKMEIGKRITYILMKDNIGENVSSLESKGNFRVISFWATWDTLSVKQMKEVVAISKKLDKRPLSFINVSVDANDSIWRKAIKDLKLPGRNIRLKEGFADETAKKLGILTLPGNIILDNQSMIVEKNIFGKELEEYLQVEATAAHVERIKMGLN